MIPEGEELKCHAILPTIGPPKRQESGDRRKLSRDNPRSRGYTKSRDNRFNPQAYGRRYNHNSIKYTRSATDKASDVTVKRFEPLREIGDNRQNMSFNEIDRSNERLGLKVKKIDASLRVPKSFISTKRPINTQTNISELLKFSPNTQKDEHNPKLILCDDQGFPLHEFVLERFLENECSDVEALRNYFCFVLSKGSAENSSLIELSANSHIQIPSHFEESNQKKDTGIFVLRYDKVMKEVSINYKKEILKRVANFIPELTSQKMRLLSYIIELVKSKNRDVIIRLKKKALSTKETISSKNLGIGEVISKVSAKNLPPGSAGTVGLEVKLTPLNSRNTKRPLVETAKESEEVDIQRVSLRNYISFKPSTLIKILHEDYNHLAEHEINKAIAFINKFIVLTFKNKEGAFDNETILRMAKTMKINLTKKGIGSVNFKDKEFSYNIREQLGKYLSSIINNSNNYDSSESTLKGLQYRFFIGKGNNGVMVRTVLKQRWWWNYGSRKDDNLNLLWTEWCKPKYINKLPCGVSKSNDFPQITNHFERHYHLSNKKAMFINLQRYYKLNGQDPFLALPLTFHIREGIKDPQFLKFTEYYNRVNETIKSKTKKHEKNVWIIKPGEYSNRGCGISIMQDYSEIKKFIMENGRNPRTYILQKYIEKPLLISKRKFDIRMYGMLTSVNGIIKGYFYEEGYIRTSCKEYTLKNLAQKAIHLTNDAVQKKDESYGKYENGNKLSFTDFQKYLDTNYSSLNIDFFRDLLPQIKVYIEYLPIENNHRLF